MVLEKKWFKKTVMDGQTDEVITIYIYIHDNFNSFNNNCLTWQS